MLPQKGELEIDPDLRLEREAEETAEQVMRGGKLGIHRMRHSEVHVQRAKDLEHGKSGRDDREGIASELEFPDRQLQKKFKHAKRFGVNGSWNKENKNRFNMALINHIESPDTERISGTYRGEKVFHFYNSETKNNVITTRDGEFISGWTLSNKQEEHLTKSGDL